MKRFFSYITHLFFKKQKAMSDDNSPFQKLIGSKITRFVMIGTLVIGILTVGFAFYVVYKSQTKDENTFRFAFSIMQYAFGTLLPLWGTWIGTVLAFYFGKENFEAANKSVQQMVDKLTSDKKLESVKAKDVMIKLNDLKHETVTGNEGLEKFTLSVVLDDLRKEGVRRLIILDDQNRGKFAIHRDLITNFVATQTLAAQPVAGLTLKDFYDKSPKDVQDTVDNSVRFISEDANLLAAKKIMVQYKTCQDVFVTTNGQRDEAVLGWITNVTIDQNSVI